MIAGVGLLSSLCLTWVSRSSSLTWNPSISRAFPDKFHSIGRAHSSFLLCSRAARFVRFLIADYPFRRLAGVKVLLLPVRNLGAGILPFHFFLPLQGLFPGACDDARPHHHLSSSFLGNVYALVLSSLFHPPLYLFEILFTPPPAPLGNRAPSSWSFRSSVGAESRPLASAGPTFCRRSRCSWPSVQITRTRLPPRENSPHSAPLRGSATLPFASLRGRTLPTVELLRLHLLVHLN